MHIKNGEISVSFLSDGDIKKYKLEMGLSSGISSPASEHLRQFDENIVKEL